MPTSQAKDTKKSQYDNLGADNNPSKNRSRTVCYRRYAIGHIFISCSINPINQSMIILYNWNNRTQDKNVELGIPTCWEPRNDWWRAFLIWLSDPLHNRTFLLWKRILNLSYYPRSFISAINFQKMETHMSDHPSRKVALYTREVSASYPSNSTKQVHFSTTMQETNHYTTLSSKLKVHTIRHGQRKKTLDTTSPLCLTTFIIS